MLAPFYFASIIWHSLVCVHKSEFILTSVFYYERWRFENKTCGNRKLQTAATNFL